MYIHIHTHAMPGVYSAVQAEDGWQKAGGSRGKAWQDSGYDAWDKQGSRGGKNGYSNRSGSEHSGWNSGWDSWNSSTNASQAWRGREENERLDRAQ